VVLVEKILIQGIPSLHIVARENASKKLPLIIFSHGFTSAKENNLHYAYLLAENGLRVVLPEAIHHGERSTNLSKVDLSLHFWNIVIQTIDEISLVKEYFETKGLIDIDRIGLAGTSMGAIVTLGALTRYNWVHSAVSLMGSPSYVEFAHWQLEGLKKSGYQLPLTEEEQNKLFNLLKQYDLSLQPEILGRRPLFFWHGKLDHTVPYEYSYQFFQKMRDNHYPVEYLLDNNAGHQVTREGLLKTVDWFVTHFNFSLSS
jgi:uncharacterized protein